MALNLKKKSRSGVTTIERYLEKAHEELDFDLVGMWNLIPEGRETYNLKDADLREFLVYAIIQLLAYGAKVIEQQGDTRIYWEETTRFGTKPDEIAFNIVKEWNAQGEPDRIVWQGVAFAKPEWLASDANERKKHQK